MSERFDDFAVLVDVSGADVRLSLSGDIDLASVAALREALQHVSDATGGDVEVDLSQTSFCDSAGLHALLAAQRQLGATGRTMRLVDPPSAVVRLLQLTATSELFHVITREDRRDGPAPR